MTKEEIRGLVSATLTIVIIIAVLLLSKLINVAEAIQIMLYFILVLVTVTYVKRTADIAKATKEQADASVKMAREMREQRRPIVVAEAVSSTVENGVEIEYSDSDIFKIRNLGNAPAIELEVLLLNQGEGQLGSERRTFLAQTDEPIEFWPSGLEGQLNYTCYILCRYRGAFSRNEGQLWYTTRLPFVPVKSQRGDKIIIQAKELEFDEVTEKKSY